VSPRPYRLGQRQAANEQTRGRILEAARELLSASASMTGFTVEAVARQAGVARMTVYYQFGSKAGLLEALFDAIAARGGMRKLPAAFQRSEPAEALAQFISTFVGFWASDRLLMRRLHGLAVLDPDLGEVLRAREEGRRQGLRALVHRLAEVRGRPAPPSAGAVVDVLHTLTSFETFDSLAGAARDAEDVGRLVHALSLAAIDL